MHPTNTLTKPHACRCYRGREVEDVSIGYVIQGQHPPPPVPPSTPANVACAHTHTPPHPHADRPTDRTVWQSLEHHRRFLSHPNFGRTRAILDANIDARAPSGPPSVVHILHAPTAARTLAQPAVQVFTGRLKGAERRVALEALLARLPEDTEGHAFGGATLEDREVYYVLLGCRTVEVRRPIPHSGPNG